MAKKVSLENLRHMLVNANVRATCDTDPFVRMSARDEVRRLKARIARRERDEARAALGLTKVKGALGGTYWE